MKWLDRLLGKPPPDADGDLDRQALKDLHAAFNNVQNRTNRLERELLRVNEQLRQRSPR